MRLSFQRAMAFVCLAAVLLLVPLFITRAQAQQSLSVADLQAFIKSAIKQKSPDKDVAKFLASVKMTERLSPAVVEELRSAGAGPQTVTALTSLATKTASLNPAPTKMEFAKPAPTGPPEPSEAVKDKALEATREWALNYVKSLPDFICMEDTLRSADFHYEIGSEGSWSPQDRLIEKLTYFDHKENYELQMHNDNATYGKTWENVGGSISRGEWATLLGEIFSPASHTSFHWQRWGTIRGHLTHVFQYSVEQQYSQETIAYGDTASSQQRITAGFHGLIYVESGSSSEPDCVLDGNCSNVVLRITVTPDIPPSFPVQDVDQTVDYDYQQIGTMTFLLPYTSTMKMRDGHIAWLNNIAWRKYSKYSAQSDIKYDTADVTPLPDDKTKEQPASSGK